MEKNKSKECEEIRNKILFGPFYYGGKIQRNQISKVQK